MFTPLVCIVPILGPSQVRKSGYPIRLPHQQFVDDYCITQEEAEAQARMPRLERPAPLSNAVSGLSGARWGAGDGAFD